MREMMMAKLMALKKLKRQMHQMMMHEKDEHEMEREGPSMKMENIEEYALDDDPMDMHNREDEKEEIMIPRGRTRAIMGSFMKPKKNIMSMGKK
jgi:hypothetical protein